MCLVLIAGPAMAQGYSTPPLPRILNVSISIPAIAVNSIAVVQVPMAGMVPGDGAVPSLAAGSNAMPTNVTASAVVNCTTAGTAIVSFINESGGLTAASAATTVTMNFSLFH